MSGRPAVTAAPHGAVDRGVSSTARNWTEKRATPRLPYSARDSQEEARELSEALLDVKASIVLCATCQNVTEHDPCPLCADRPLATAR